VTFVPFGGLEQQPEIRVFDEDGALLGHLKRIYWLRID
jgi:hypothetical protein